MLCFFSKIDLGLKQYYGSQAEKSNNPTEDPIWDKIVSDSTTPQVLSFYRIPQICQEYSTPPICLKKQGEYSLDISSDFTTKQVLGFYLSFRILQICSEYSPH